MKKTASLSSYILAFVIILTNLTQMPQMIGLGFNSYINLACWGGLLLFILSKRQFGIERTKLPILVYGVVFILMTLLLEAFIGNTYLQTALVYPYLLCIFVFAIGSLYANIYHEISIDTIFLSYIASGLVVALSVFLYSFSAGFDWGSRSYAYEAKNSVAQIILTVVLLLVFAKASKKIPKSVRIITVVLLIVLMGMLKSRASLVGILAIVFFILFNKNFSKATKRTTLIISLSFILLVAIVPSLNEIVVEGILFAGRDSENLNDLTSGRADMVADFFSSFGDYFLFGRGLYYLESFPLSLLMQYGVIGSIPVILHLVLPFTLIKRMKNKNNRAVIIAILICYYVNGLFEELAPLGPGVKCYFLWFLLGLEKNVAEKEALHES